MSQVDEVIELKQRDVMGKGLAKLRMAGLVPGVLHNHGAPSIHVEAPETRLEAIYKEAGKHHPLQVKVGSQEFLALIKDVHFNPVKRRMQHIVFMAIKQDEKVEAEVPIRLEGEIPAEKAGLMVLRQLDSVEVEALPKNLPDEFVIDGSKLVELHDRITVADLELPSGVELRVEPEHPIAMVVETKAQISEETEEGVLTPEEAEERAEEAGDGQGETGNAPKDAEHDAAGRQAPNKPGENR